MLVVGRLLVLQSRITLFDLRFADHAERQLQIPHHGANTPFRKLFFGRVLILPSASFYSRCDEMKFRQIIRIRDLISRVLST